MDGEDRRKGVEEREIDGVRYEVWRMSFDVGKPALVRLLGIFGAALKDAVGPEGLVGIKTFGALAGALKVEDLSYFEGLFGSVSRYWGTIPNGAEDWIPLVRQNQTAHFEGRYDAYFSWLGFCAEVNFRSFFRGRLPAPADTTATPATK